MKINVVLEDGATAPRHSREGDAGLDLTSRETVEIAPGETVMVGTGVRMEIPEGCFGLVVPRSGVAAKRGVTLANTPGVIDSNYRGEIKLPLHNIAPSMRWVGLGVEGAVVGQYWDRNPDTVTIERGERVAQIIIMRHETVECVEVEELSETERGAGGFGSSGK